MRSYFLKTIKSLWSWQFLSGIILIILFVSNAFHETYPDEFDNILGGWFTLHGHFLYSGYFTHHGPVPYLIAALVELFSGQSFVVFRLFYSLIVLLMLVVPYFYIRKSYSKNISFYPWLIGFIGLASTYYWSHMLLADNIAAFCFLAVYGLIILKAFSSKNLTNSDILFISILSALGVYSSLTYLYLYLITIFYTMFLFYSKVKDLNFKKSNLKPIFYILLPHVIFALYLTLTGSIGDYLYQNIVFNAKYYIYNYPRSSDSTFINPVRYAIVILNNFMGSFYILALGIRNFSFDFPLNTTMATLNFSLVLYLLFRRKYSLVFFIFLTLVYANARSNPLNSKETDYQSAVYILLSFFNSFFALNEIYRSINLTRKNGKRLIFSTLFLISFAYMVMSLIFLVKSFSDKYFAKYMGKAPLIYDRPSIAPVVNTALSSQDYVWIGPFEFEELFYTNARPASGIQILIPGIGKSKRLQDKLISDLQKTKPKIVVFDKNFFILGTKVESYTSFFQSYLDKHYTNLLNYRNGSFTYHSRLPISVENKLDLDAKTYIRKDVVEEVAKKLVEKGYLEKIEVNE